MKNIIINTESLRVNNGRKLDSKDVRANKIKASFSDDELFLLDNFIKDNEIKSTRAEVLRILLLENLKSKFFDFSAQYNAYIEEVKSVADEIYDIVKFIKNGNIYDKNNIEKHLIELFKISSKYDLKKKLTAIIMDENYDFVSVSNREKYKNEITIRLNKKEFKLFENIYNKYSNISRAEFVSSLSMYNALKPIGFLSTKEHREYINIISRMINNIYFVLNKSNGDDQYHLKDRHKAIINYYDSFSLHSHADKIIKKILKEKEKQLVVVDEEEVLKQEPVVEESREDKIKRAVREAESKFNNIDKNSSLGLKLFVYYTNKSFEVEMANNTYVNSLSNEHIFNFFQKCNCDDILLKYLDLSKTSKENANKYIRNEYSKLAMEERVKDAWEELASW